MDERKLAAHIEAAADALDSGFELDRILSDLRRSGLSIAESIWTIRSVTGMSLTEAKRMIEDSHAWADVHDDIVEDHAMLRRIVEERATNLPQEGEGKSKIDL